MSMLDHSQDCLIIFPHVSIKTNDVDIQKNHLIEIDENFFCDFALKMFVYLDQ